MSLHTLTNAQHEKLWSFAQQIAREEHEIAGHRENIAGLKEAAKDELKIDSKTLKLCVDVLQGRVDLNALGSLADEITESLERCEPLTPV